MSTPAAIARATERAERVKKLMLDTDTANDTADPILDQYESALGKYKAGLADIKDKTKALEAMLPAMGNAAAVLDDAFREGSKAAQPAPPAPVDQGMGGYAVQTNRPAPIPAQLEAENDPAR